MRALYLSLIRFDMYVRTGARSVSGAFLGSLRLASVRTEVCSFGKERWCTGLKEENW